MLRGGSNSDCEVVVGLGASEHEQRCERVHRNLKRIVKARGALDAQECAALREAQKLMIWRAHGCASLVEYMERELGYTARSAVERLRVAKAIEEVPELGEAMNQGDLSFSGARELSRVITPETQQEWIGAAQELNVRQIEEMVSGHKPGDRPTDAPDPALRTKVLRHEVRLSVAELERRARKALQRLRGSSVDDSDFMEACFKAVLDQCEQGRSTKAAARVVESCEKVAAPVVESGATAASAVADSGAMAASGAAANEGPSATAPFVIGNRVLSEAEIERLLQPRYQIAITRIENGKQGWQHGTKSVLLSPPELERAMCDCVDIGDIDGEPGRATRSIPKRVKRHVLHRDGFCCRVPECTATANIDVHHILFVVNGGTNAPENLITLCEGHHLAVHAGSLVIAGDAVTAKFVCKPQSKFKIATRAVECAAALRARGVAGELVKAAVDATRTHVGMQDHTTEQWVDIALTKVPASR